MKSRPMMTGSPWYEKYAIARNSSISLVQAYAQRQLRTLAITRS